MIALLILLLADVRSAARALRSRARSLSFSCKPDWPRALCKPRAPRALCQPRRPRALCQPRRPRALCQPRRPRALCQPRRPRTLSASPACHELSASPGGHELSPPATNSHPGTGLTRPLQTDGAARRRDRSVPDPRAVFEVLSGTTTRPRRAPATPQVATASWVLATRSPADLTRQSSPSDNSGWLSGATWHGDSRS
jgi:hypothetical protein